MNQAAVGSVPGASRVSNRFSTVALIVGAMLLGAIMALGANALFNSLQTSATAGSVAAPAPITSTTSATDSDRAVVAHNQAERSEAPAIAPLAGLRPATDNDRAVVKHNQQERAEAPSNGD
jgi:hypothetical protein